MALAGWYVDPSGRHQHRYYDGTAWTEHVANRGATGIDPTRGLRLPTPADSGRIIDTTTAAVQARGDESRPRRTTQQALKRFGEQMDNRLGGGARWAQLRFRKEASGLPTVMESGPASSLAQWTGLGSAIAQYATTASGVVGGGELLGVLQAIIGCEDAENRMLRSIEANVRLLVNEPLSTGRTHLEEARRIGTYDPNQRWHIEQAKECFYRAHGQAPSVQNRALVDYHLGVTWLLLDRPSDATHWLGQSHAAAVGVLDELARQSQNVKVLKSQASAAAFAYFYPVGVFVLPVKFKRVWQAERARTALEEFLPFVACVARSYNALSERGGLPAFELIASGVSSFELVTIPA